MIFGWVLVFCQGHVLKFVLLNFSLLSLDCFILKEKFYRMVFSPDDRAKCIFLFITTTSVSQVQRNFKCFLYRIPFTTHNYEFAKEVHGNRNCIAQKMYNARPTTSDENIECVHVTFHQSTDKSVRTASIDHAASMV